ncbi:MAG: HAD family hydrolase [Coriobacteriales bacterium]|nr:HAD family hydrolase [Coriobacteriales bacterium]
MASYSGSTPVPMAVDSPQVQSVAVFDYDGTCIDGQSGSLLARWLLRKGYLSPRTSAKLAWWGARYKFHMPYRQEEARELIFGALEERSPEEVDRILTAFHNEILLPRYREEAVREVALRHSEGCATVLISATFYEIAREASKYLHTDGFVATRMELDDQGNFTGKVLGDVIVGEAKVQVAREWADERFGAEGWNLSYAYGDHHSDKELLEAADHPFAVTPGPTLKKVAQRKGWTILDWDK